MKCTICGNNSGHIKVVEQGTDLRGILCLSCFMQRSVNKPSENQHKKNIPSITENNLINSKATEIRLFLLKSVIEKNYISVQFIKQIIAHKYKTSSIIRFFIGYLRDIIGSPSTTLLRHPLSILFSTRIALAFSQLPPATLQNLWKIYPTFHSEFCYFFPFSFLQTLNIEESSFFIRKELENKEGSSLEVSEYKEFLINNEDSKYIPFLIYRFAEFCVYESKKRSLCLETSIIKEFDQALKEIESTTIITQ